MGTAVRLLPVALSAVLLAAHFSRGGSPALTAIALGFPFLLFVRRPWAARVVQAVLVVGALEWVRTAVRLAGARAAMDRPWLRLAVILGTVAAFTLTSALVFRSPRLRRFWLDRDQSGPHVPGPGRSGD